MNCEGTKFVIDNVTYYCLGNGAMSINPDTPVRVCTCKCIESIKYGIDKTVYWIRHINGISRKEIIRDLLESEKNIFHRLTQNKSYWISGDYAMLMYHYIFKNQKNILFTWGNMVDYSTNKIDELCELLGEKIHSNESKKFLSPYGWSPSKDQIGIAYIAQDITPEAMVYLDQIVSKKKYILVSTNRMSLSEYVKKHRINIKNIIELHI